MKGIERPHEILAKQSLKVPLINKIEFHVPSLRVRFVFASLKLVRKVAVIM